MKYVLLVKLPLHYSFYVWKIKKKKTATQGKLRPPVELTRFSDKKDSFCLVLKALINLSPPTQFLDGLFRSYHYLELRLRFVRLYSTRLASSSKALLVNISTKEILEKEHWSEESIFQKFYFRNFRNIKK